MRKILFLSFIALIAGSCDLLFNRDSGSSPPAEDIQIASLEVTGTATQGEVITVDVVVKNPGFRDISDEITVTLEDQTEDTLLGTKSIEGGLASKDSLNVSYELNTGEFTVGEHLIVASHNIDDDNAANDSLTSTLGINEPDITDISVAAIAVPNMVTEGDVVDVQVSVENIGNQDVSGAINVVLNDETAGQAIGTQTISDGIAEGDSTALTYSWDTGGASIGDHKLTASMDFSDENPDNNSRSQTVTVSEAPVADIAITTLEAPESATQGDNVRVSLTVQNVGNLDASEDFEVVLTDQTDGTELARETVEGGLAPDNKAVFTIDWNTGRASIGEHTLAASHSFEDENTGNDSRTAKVTIKVAPVTDIAVTEINAPSSANQGDKVDVSVTLTNQGNQNLNEPLEVTLRDETDGTTIDTKTISPDEIQPKNSATLNFTWDTKDASLGDHELVASHNLDDDNGENDSRSTTVTVNEPPFIDLEVVSVSTPSSSAKQGDNVTVSVQLRNRGNRDIGDDFTVTLRDEKDGGIIGTKTVNGGLDEGDSITRNFTWNTDKASLGDHTLTASHNLNDDNSSNNSRSTEVSIFLLDLAITKLETDDEDNVVRQGDRLIVEVTLGNVGNQDANQPISVSLFDQTAGSEIGTQIIGRLDEGDSATFIFSWFTLTASPEMHTLVASHNFEDDKADNDSRSIVVEVIPILGDDDDD